MVRSRKCARMLIGAIDKLKVALLKKRLSTPTFRAALSRFILTGLYRQWAHKLQLRYEPPKAYHSSYTKRYTRRRYLPHADIFHRINRREAKLQICQGLVWCGLGSLCNINV